jgi:hypothetical protein
LWKDLEWSGSLLLTWPKNLWVWLVNCLWNACWCQEAIHSNFSFDFKTEKLAKEWKNILVVSFFSFQTNECNRKLWNYQYCQVDYFLKKFMDMWRLLLTSRSDIHF